MTDHLRAIHLRMPTVKSSKLELHIFHIVLQIPQEMDSISVCASTVIIFTYGKRNVQG